MSASAVNPIIVPWDVFSYSEAFKKTNELLATLGYEIVVDITTTGSKAYVINLKGASGGA